MVFDTIACLEDPLQEPRWMLERLKREIRETDAEVAVDRDCRSGRLK
jgi:hypothetical protein